MNNDFSSLIASANSILILLPNKPYFDQVAAGLSLFLSLKGTKEVSISSSAPMTVEFNRLIGVNKIINELGNKNLTIRFKNYQAESIERVSADVDGSEFKLTVIPKVGTTSPKKEQVELSSSGVAADLVILVGGANDSHFPAVGSQELSGVKIAHLGIKQLLTESDKGIMSFTLPVSSVSELIAILIKELGLTIDGDTATNLIAGIEEGSNHFTQDGVTAGTFEIFAQLLRSGGARLPKEGLIKKSYPQGAIPGKMPVKPAAQSTPKDWFEPKIYKGTSVS